MRCGRALVARMLDIARREGCKTVVLETTHATGLYEKFGFTVTGESACASPENFNAEIGRHVARENAVAKVWPLMGYALKERLSR